jgi:16S rRNA (cytosine1402-N4)-methyltransferase
MIKISLKRIEQEMEIKDSHIPVMYREVVELLNIAPGATIVDCTLGLGGHSKMILEKLGSDGKLIGVDRDNRSLAVAKENLSEYEGQYELVHDDFRHIDQVLSKLNINQVDGILMDLGISSFQLNDPQRGFSFKNDGPLDMRMDQESYISAYDLINSLSENEISSILKNFGEERYHHRIARYLVEQRSKTPFQTTQELSEAIVRSIPGHSRHQKIHPATRAFQAFRIAVNRELEALEITLDKSVDCLRSGGRICVIAFHSLEDRIVKHKFRAFAKEGKVQLITKKPLYPTDEEVLENSRARSAKLRVAERL